MSAVNYGRKIGTFEVDTVLCAYVLDVRFSVSEEQFAVLVPSVPGQSVVPGNYETFELFRGPVLAAVMPMDSTMAVPTAPGNVS